MSRRLDAGEYARLVAGGRVLERDGHGVKVWWLPGDRILKLFRVKRWFTSARLRPYHVRFARNAARLARLGVPVPRVEQLCRIPHLKRQGVVYRMLPGRTLSDLLAPEPPLELLERLAAFLAELHQEGVYFRSVHPGNVLLCEDGRLGLIDLQDVRFRRRPLNAGERARNIRHLFAGGRHGASLRRWGLEPFLELYLRALPWDEGRRRRLRQRLLRHRALQSLITREKS